MSTALGPCWSKLVNPGPTSATVNRVSGLKPKGAAPQLYNPSVRTTSLPVVFFAEYHCSSRTIHGCNPPKSIEKCSSTYSNVDWSNAETFCASYSHTIGRPSIAAQCAGGI